MFELVEFDTPVDLVRQLTGDLVTLFTDRLAREGKISWAVSGGSTPVPLFHAMAREPLNWSQIHVCLVDERWVPVGHPRSNEALIRRELLQGLTKAAPFMGMWRSNATPQDAAQGVDADYATLPLPLASVLLGLGSDGHTASLFPGADGLDHAFDKSRPDLCAAISAKRSAVTGDETERMTLTTKAIKEAGHVALMIVGDEKREVFETCLGTKPLSPITRIANSLDLPLQVYWAP